jgi:hypothetical protein
LLAIALAFSLSALAGASSNQMILTPAISVADSGDIFEVHLALDSAVTNVMVYAAHVKYDSSVIRLIDAWPDSAWYNLSEAGTQYFRCSTIVEVDGVSGDTTWYVRVFDLIWSGVPKKTIDGYAEIATLQFEALANGASYLYCDTTVIKDQFDNTVVSKVKDAVVYVCPLPLGYLFASDVNGNGLGPDISDLIYMVTYMFQGGPEPIPIVLSADINCDLGLDITDLIFLVNYMFQGGPLPCDHCP